MNKSIYAALGSLVCGIALHGMQELSLQQNVNNRYEQFKQAHNNLMPQTPLVVKKALHEWMSSRAAEIANITSPDLIVQDPEKNTLKEFYDKKFEQDKKDKDANDSSANLSKYSFKLPFKVENDVYLACFAGPVFKRENANAHLHRGWGSKFSSSEYDDYCKKNGPVFVQGISRYTNNIAMEKCMALSKSIKCTFPAMYLEQIPGRPADVNDQNYVVVQKFISNLVPLGSKDVIKGLTPHDVDELYTLCLEGGFWDMKESNIMKDQYGKFVVIDSEQASSTSPAEFLQTPAWRVKHNGFSGLEGLHKLMVEHGNTECADYLKKQAQADLSACVLRPDIIDQLITPQLCNTFEQRYNEQCLQESKEEYMQKSKHDFLKNRISGYFAQLK